MRGGQDKLYGYYSSNPKPKFKLRRTSSATATCTCRNVSSVKPICERYSLQNSVIDILSENTNRRAKQHIYGKVIQMPINNIFVRKNATDNSMKRSKRLQHNNPDDSINSIYADLDYRSIKSYIKTASHVKKTKLLQAIRWVRKIFLKFKKTRNK